MLKIKFKGEKSPILVNDLGEAMVVINRKYDTKCYLNQLSKKK